MSVDWKTRARYRVTCRRTPVPDAPVLLPFSDTVRPIEYRLARSHADYFDAFRLLQCRFAATGLTRSEDPIRVEPFHLRNDAQVMLAVRGCHVIGCLTFLQGKNPHGLPLERSHPGAFDNLPDKRLVGEVTSLAIDPECRNSEVFVGLMQLTQLFALGVDIEYAVGVAHPKHARIYRKVMGFEIVGDEVPCTRVDGQPGVALAVKIDHSATCPSRWHQRFNLARQNDTDLHPSPMTASQRSFFAEYVGDRRSRAA